VAFEGGSISFRMFYLPHEFPPDLVDRFADAAAPSLDRLKDGEINGWVTGRHLLDRRINSDTAYFGGHLRLTLMQAARKIPEALLKAECKMEEYARQEAQGVDTLKPTERSAIRQDIIKRLLPQMPPQLKGIPFVHNNNGTLFAAALSDKQSDAFLIHFTQTLGMQLIPVTPETAAAKRRATDVRDWEPISFSPEVEDTLAGNHPGRDFLTWLWFYSEARGGLARLDGLGEFAVVVEGPLLFVLEGQGAHEAVLRKGEPLLSAEAKTSLISGKKLKRAKLTLARGDQAWSATLDADTFVFRGLRLPESEPLDAISRFQQRMLLLETFQDAFLALYDRFVDERNDPGRRARLRQEAQGWVSGRKTRK
jgi:hypothetical protein